MRKLTVVDKNSKAEGRRGTIEVHWEPAMGDPSVDVYPGGAELETDEAGQFRVTYFETCKVTGDKHRIRVLYGFGEAKKIVEKEPVL